MSLKAKCQATYSNYKGKSVRKSSAIYGRSIRLQPNPPEFSIPSSRRRKRSASNDGEEGASSGPASTPMSFMKILRLKSGTHTAECCRLVLPRAFCEKHNVETHVTMTDSAGSKLWHMRFQSCGLSRASSGPSRRSVYAISNGWREFSYDHSLKVNDRLLFTLQSTSHFVVEFATSDGSTRAMLPTSDGEDYPWKINYYRLDCLSYVNGVDSSKVWRQGHTNEKKIRTTVASNIAPNKQEAQEEMFCQCNAATVGKGMNTRNDARKEYVLPELTHLECKNPDGSSFLQIVDSDSEITGVDAV